MISAPRTVSELLALINPNPPLSSSSSFAVPSPDAWKQRVELQAALDSAEGQQYLTKVSCVESIASSNVWQPDRYIFNHHAIDHVRVKSEKRTSVTAIKPESSSGAKQTSEKKRWYSVTTTATSVTPTEATHGHDSEGAEEYYQECCSGDISDNEASGAESDYYDEDGDSVSPPAKKRPKKSMDVRRK